MARGARVALQTALGAISGGLGGYQQAQTRKKQEARQNIADLMAAEAAGFETGMPTEIVVGGQRLTRLESPLKRAERLLAEQRQAQAQQRREELQAQREARTAEREANEAFRREMANTQREFQREQAEENRRLQRNLAQLRIDAQQAAAKVRADEQAGRPPQRPTEAQEKSFQFAQRMAQANPIIEQYGPTARLDRVSAALAADNFVTRAAMNRLLSDDEQKLVVAIRQFAEPILRKNTGAAFNKEEIGWVESQVVPVSGDSEATQQYKSVSRARELSTFNDLATPAARYYQYYSTATGGGTPQPAPVVAPAGASAAVTGGARAGAPTVRRPPPNNPDEF